MLCCYSYDNAFLGGTLALPAFKARFGLTHLTPGALNTLSSNIVVTFQAGCLLACFLALPLAETLGRRKTILIASAVFLVGAVIQLTGNLGALYAGRFLTGVGVGPLTVVCPLYISEVAPAALRGRCIGLFEIMYQSGALLGFWINYGSKLHASDESDTQWRIPVSMQTPLICVLLFGCFFLPETPRFLVKKNRSTEALSVLCRFRNLRPDHDYIQRELADIHREIDGERQLMGLTEDTSRWALLKGQLRECIRPEIARRISLGVLTQMFGQLSGINGVNYYSPRIFKSLGVVGTATGLFATGIYGLVKFVTATVALFFLVDRVGRRALLLGGAAVMVFSLFFVGTYIKLAKPDPEATQITSGGIAACAFIYIFVMGYVSSFAGVPFILSSEAVPLNVRATSSALGAATQWLFNLVITKATPYMISSVGFGTFYIFGSFVVCGMVYVYFFVPETRGVALEHMQVAFGYPDTVADAEGDRSHGVVADKGESVELREAASR